MLRILIIGMLYRAGLRSLFPFSSNPDPSRFIPKVALYPGQELPLHSKMASGLASSKACVEKSCRLTGWDPSFHCKHHSHHRLAKTINEKNGIVPMLPVLVENTGANLSTCDCGSWWMRLVTGGLPYSLLHFCEEGLVGKASAPFQPVFLLSLAFSIINIPGNLPQDFPVFSVF